MPPPMHGAEYERLRDTHNRKKNWGQWGTVREDYSDDGHAWNYFTHDQARSRAYRWGEDGLLNERLFGVTGTAEFVLINR